MKIAYLTIKNRGSAIEGGRIEKGKYLRNRTKKNALRKFARGPARATKTSPVLHEETFLKFRGFTGTGLAQPK